MVTETITAYVVLGEGGRVVGATATSFDDARSLAEDDARERWKVDPIEWTVETDAGRGTHKVAAWHAEQEFGRVLLDAYRIEPVAVRVELERAAKPSHPPVQRTRRRDENDPEPTT